VNGKITKIYRDKGFGFIKGDDGEDYFFHRSGVKNARFAELEEQTEVEFEDTQAERGPRAEEIYCK
jgi:cold shock protein